MTGPAPAGASPGEAAEVRARSARSPLTGAVPAGSGPAAAGHARLAPARPAGSGRELGIAVAATLVGAGLALTASGQVWAKADVSRWPQLLAGPVQLTGRELAPAAFGLALLALAAVAALVATRGVVRRGVGALVVVCGVAVAALSVRATLSAGAAALAEYPGATSAELSRNAWPWLSALGGVVVVAAGVLTLVRGGAWPSMSRRYEKAPADAGPVDPATASPTDIWRALDRGDDPTDGDQPRTAPDR